MRLVFDPAFLSEVLRAEAEARGVAARLRTLAAAREDDGLDELDALSDAAESMGLLDDVRQAITDAVAPLVEHEIESVEVGNAFGGMPTLRRMETTVRIAVPPGGTGEVVTLATDLIREWIRDSDRTVVSLVVGLGGSGGCACGEELPEDAPPGPLFER